MARQATRRITAYGNHMFDQGVLSRTSCFHQSQTPIVPSTAAMIVEFIKENLIELAQERFVDDK
jgi:hypothetical protein